MMVMRLVEQFNFDVTQASQLLEEIKMNNKILVPLLAVFLLGSGQALADAASVAILSPANNATVSKDSNAELSYEATPGPDGDHLHLYLDGKRIDVLHPMKGKADLGMLDPGKHHVCLTVNTKGHAPTGAEACIDLTAK
jgi:hypothetical protein